MSGPCVCRHARSQHGIVPVLGEQDGRPVVVDWVDGPGDVCVWNDYPELNRLEKKGDATPCGCTGYTPKETR